MEELNESTYPSCWIKEAHRNSCVNVQCGWATLSVRGRHTFFDLSLKAIGTQRSGQRAHVYTDSLVLRQQRREIYRALHGFARIISCNIRLMCSRRGCTNSLLGFLRHLCFGSKRGKLSYSIIVRRAIKAYEEFCIRVSSAINASGALQHPESPFS